MPNALAEGGKVRKRGGESWAKWEFRLLRASTKLGGRQRGAGRADVRSGGAVCSVYGRSSNKNCCVLCRLCLGIVVPDDADLCMAAQHQQNGKGSRKGVRERKVKRGTERESNEKKIFKWGRAICVCVCMSVCVSCIFDFALQYFWLNASWAHCLCSVYFYFEHKYWTFTLLFSSFPSPFLLIPSCLAWLHHGEQTVKEDLPID